ncbi:MAG: DUF4349 domain-containing protein [Caldilineales bacterium]
MKRWFLLVMLMALLALTGCGAPAAMERDVMAPAAMPVSEQAMGSAAQPADAANLAEAPQPAADARKMIYTANISLRVTDPQAAAQQVEALATELGGYTAQTQLYQYSDSLMSGNVMIRVPAAAFEQAMARLRTLGSRVLNENSTASDVTAEYSDLEAQLRNLEAAEKELALMLSEVRQRPEAKPADILEVYNALTQKRGEIEQVKGRLQYLQNQVGFSTITVDLTPDQVNAPVIEDTWQPLVTVKQAFGSLVNVLRSLFVVAANVVIVVIPLLLLVALPVLLVFWLIRRLMQWRRREPVPPPAQES